MFLSKPVLSRIAPLALLLLAGAGCDPKDGSPAGPGGTGTPATDLETFEQQAVLTFESVNGVTASVDEIAHGDFSGIVTNLGLPQSPARAQDFVWNAADGAWVLNDSGSQSDATSSVSWTIWAWIQFRDGTGVPQAEPDATTEAITIEIDWDIYGEAEENGESFLMDLTYSDDLEVSGLPDGPFPVVGDGTLTGQMVWSLGNDVLDVRFDMAWAMDLVVPDNDGCPTGTLTVSLDQYEATATYDGTSTYSWVVQESGVVAGIGSEALSCGIPAATTPVRPWERWSALRP